VASEEERLREALLRRAQHAADAAAEVVAHSQVLAHVSAELRHLGMTTRCAWCGRYRIGDRWVVVEDSPLIHENQTSHGICDDCMRRLREAGLSS
jgi:hypothetical protein